MEKLLLSITIFIGILFSAISAHPAEDNYNNKNNKKIVVPDGMEMLRIGGANIILPKGTKMRKVGGAMILENTNEYMARKFEDIDRRLADIEADVQKLKEAQETPNQPPVNAAEDR